MGMVESYYAIKKGLPAAVALSRQQPLDCLTGAIQQPGSCSGGHFVYVAQYSQTAKYASAEAYKYAGKQEVCKTNVAVTAEKFVNSYKVYDKVTPQQLYTILTRHPVAVNIDASATEFINYADGLLKFTCGPQPTHAVLLVGYEVDPTTKAAYWLVKNSWSDQWGSTGYGKIEITDTFDGCHMYTNVVELF